MTEPNDLITLSQAAHDDLIRLVEAALLRKGKFKSEWPEYRIWQGMLSRCLLPTNYAYDRYGGRGIKVCERWRTFANFYADMGDRPHGKSLDRINNDGDYEPGNVRWATTLEQAHNCRTGKRERIITFNGKTQSLAKWAKEVGIQRPALVRRLDRGIPLEEALTKKLVPKRRAVFTGVIKMQENIPDDLITTRQAAILRGCHQRNIQSYVYRGRLVAYGTGRTIYVSRSAVESLTALRAGRKPNNQKGIE